MRNYKRFYERIKLRKMNRKLNTRVYKTSGVFYFIYFFFVSSASLSSKKIEKSNNQTRSIVLRSNVVYYYIYNIKCSEHNKNV
jgi:hypothetical protein